MDEVDKGAVMHDRHFIRSMRYYYYVQNICKKNKLYNEEVERACHQCLMTPLTPQRRRRRRRKHQCRTNITSCFFSYPLKRHKSLCVFVFV